MGADSPKVWHEFRPRPAHVSLLRMVVRLFWNPAWNDNLYLVSCAERVQGLPTQHAVGDIRKRIQEEVGPAHAGEMLRFRLVFVRREGEVLSQEVAYVSEPFDAAPPSTC